MDNDTLGLVERILTLGWPGLVTIMLWVMWNRYNKLQNDYIDTLKQVAGLTQPPIAAQRVGMFATPAQHPADS